jgi:O-antigen ligase
VLAVALARYGSPAKVARDAWHSFTAHPVAAGSNLNNRLIDLSGSGRIDHWRVAAHEIAAHPWLGSGAGTFGEYWFQLRPSTVIVHDTHNLYLETLAEIGPIGLALLVLLLAGVIVAAARSRSPLAAVAVGACVAYTLHAAADWDWEQPALLVAVLLPALAVVGDPAPRPAVPLRKRVAPTMAVVLVGAFALFTLLGNIALARSGNASDATHWRQAESEARSALDLVPWSAEPWRKLAVAQVGRGEIQAARNSLREAVTIEPRDWSLWYQLSEVSTGALHRHALAQADRLNPKRTSNEATPGDLRLVVIP